MIFSTMAKPRIYLAGPDVFAPNRDEIFARLRAACASAGLEGMAPCDGGQSRFVSPQEQARWIYDENIRLLKECDGVIANLNGFRGVEPDSGTSFEVGFAAAMGKPVALVIESESSWEERVTQAFGSEKKKDGDYDQTHGAMIEAFELPANLMLAFGSCVWARNPEAAARELSKQFGKGAEDNPAMRHLQASHRTGAVEMKTGS